MILTLLQLNSNADNFWDKLIAYLTKNDFDIIQLQEVCGKNSISGNINCKRDCYEELKKILREKYKSELIITQRYSSSPSSFIGNATFYKSSFALIQKSVVPFYEIATPFPSDSHNFEETGRGMLHLILKKDNKKISLLNTHFAWAKTPKEEPHQTKQGELLLAYLKHVDAPFVLSGDFNLDPQQPTIKKINQLARNLVTENNITNTLNPRTHGIKQQLANGLAIAVDYIFTSKEITVKNFSIIEEDLSDHLGLKTIIEI